MKNFKYIIEVQPLFGQHDEEIKQEIKEMLEDMENFKIIKIILVKD